MSDLDEQDIPDENGNPAATGSFNPAGETDIVPDTSSAQPMDMDTSSPATVADADETEPTDTSDVEQQGPVQQAGPPAPDQSTQVPTDQAQSPPPMPPSGTTPPAQIQQELSTEDQAHAMDLANKHITPKTYQSLFDNTGTMGKIGTLFGLLMSGAGSGLSHQPNAVMGMMQNEIENDLAAQKQNQTNKQNIYKLVQENELNKANIKSKDYANQLTAAQTGLTKEQALTQPAQRALIQGQAQLTQAEAGIKTDALAHMHANRYALDYLAQLDAKIPATLADGVTPNPDKIKSQQVLMMAGQGVDQMNSNLIGKAASQAALVGAMTQTSNLNPNDPEGAFKSQVATVRIKDPQAAAEMEAHHIPGYSARTSVPVPDPVRNSIVNKTNFQNKLDQFTQFAQANHGKMDIPTMQQGAVYADALKTAYGQATDGFKFPLPGDDTLKDTLLNKTISTDPTALFAQLRVMPTLGAVKNSTQGDLNSTLQGLGLYGKTPAKPTADVKANTPSIPVPSKTSTTEGATGMANGKPVVFKNGKWVYK